MSATAIEKARALVDDVTEREGGFTKTECEVCRGAEWSRQGETIFAVHHPDCPVSRATAPEDAQAHGRSD